MKKLRFVLLFIVLIVFVVFSTNVIDFGGGISYESTVREMSVSFSDSEGRPDFKSGEVRMKEDGRLKIGYNDLVIEEGSMTIRFTDREAETFIEKLNENSPRNESFMIEGLKAGDYEIELILKQAESGEITLFWEEIYE